MTKLADSKYVWWFFAIAIVFVYFYGLGFPLVGPDEPRYAQVAREMFERGDWITPTLGGFDWFEKPALLYWLQIISYKLFGLNEYAARFGSALFGFGTVASMWLLGRFSNSSNEKSQDVDFANLLGLITATTLGILVFAHGASFDIIVTFPLTASLVGFFIADRADSNEDRKRIVGLVAFYFFAGLAVLAKGLIGIVFPFGIAGLYYVLSRRLPSKAIFQSLIWGALLLLAVAATWNVPMYVQHGWKFIDEFYVQHHFQRYTSNKYQHPQPFYFYFWVLPLMTLPWLPWFVAGTYSSIRERFSSVGRVDDESRSSLTLFAFSCILVPLLFFSVSGSKLPGYILPAVPGALVISGICIGRFISNGGIRRHIVTVTAALLLFAIPLLLTFVVPKFADDDSVKRLVQAADQAGYAESRVVGFRTVSHNAEFYAAGRLVRDENGKQIRFDDTRMLAKYVALSERPVLALVPLKRIEELTGESCFVTNEINRNRDLTIVTLEQVSVPCR